MNFYNENVLNEATLVRLYRHTLDRNIGIISAFRGRYTKQENMSRSGQLESAIRAAGFGFYRLEGHYIEGYGSEQSKDVKERSYLIIGNKGDDSGNLKGFLKKMGAKFNQDSILYKSYDTKNAVLIGTQSQDEDGNKVEFPGLGKEFSVGEFKPMKVNQFYSKMKGKPFVFESYAIQKSWFEAFADYIRSKQSETP
jgi:hypothetical protein